MSAWWLGANFESPTAPRCVTEDRTTHIGPCVCIHKGVSHKGVSQTDRTKLLRLVEECLFVVCFSISRFHEEQVRYPFHTVACIHLPHPHCLTKRVSASSPGQPACPILWAPRLVVLSPHVSPTNLFTVRNTLVQPGMHAYELLNQHECSNFERSRL